MPDTDPTPRLEPTSERKLEHIRINLMEDVSSAIRTGFERYAFVHRALPEIDLHDVSLLGSFLGHPFRAPFLISSMTGGAEGLEVINRRLAEAAQERGIVLAVGSQRAMLESADLADTFNIRSLAPDCMILANLGAVQLNYGYGLTECLRAVEILNADGLILHLNPLQEALQPEGNTRWSGLLKRIEACARALPVPLIVKEVGYGISGPVARQLVAAGAAAIDVAGAGGTSWSQVEMHRARSALERDVAAAFVGWGIPTAECLRQVRAAVPDTPLIASGGLRSGIDAAKALAMGASLVGLAAPLLAAAMESTAAVIERLDVLIETLRITMFAIGVSDLAKLRDTQALVHVG